MPDHGEVFANNLQLKYNVHEMKLGAGKVSTEMRNQSRHCNVYSSE